MPLTLLELRDGDSRVELAPGRGGMVTRFAASGREVLYLDEASLLDETRNVRGGIPILFPIAGRLTGDAFEHQGRRYELKQHGFARNRAWQVTAHETRSATLSLWSDEASRAGFPFDFHLEFTYRLEGPQLTIAQRYQNRGTESMPLHAGFHPYFLVADGEKGSTRIDTRATRAFDNVTKVEGPFPGFDLTRTEVDLHLRDHGSDDASLVLADGSRIELEGSPEFSSWVVWTVEKKDFVCLEPWTAPGGALASGKNLLWIPAGGVRELSLLLRHVS